MVSGLLNQFFRALISQKRYGNSVYSKWHFLIWPRWLRHGTMFLVPLGDPGSINSAFCIQCYNYSLIVSWVVWWPLVTQATWWKSPNSTLLRCLTLYRRANPHFPWDCTQPNQESSKKWPNIHSLVWYTVQSWKQRRFCGLVNTQMLQHNMNCSNLVYAGGNTTTQGRIREEHTLPEETQACSD